MVVIKEWYRRKFKYRSNRTVIMTRLLDLGIFFNFILKFRLLNKFFRSPKKLWSCSSIYFLSIQLLIVMMQTAGKQVHEMVLIYRLISRQPPFCVFDDIFNLFIIRTFLSNLRFLITGLYLVCEETFSNQWWFLMWNIFFSFTNSSTQVVFL